MKIAAAQIACALGDVDANIRKMRDFSARAQGRRRGADRLSRDGGYRLRDAGHPGSRDAVD